MSPSEPAPIESAWPKYPDYRIDLVPYRGRVRARQGELLLAESDRALLVLETDHKPVMYFPEEDVRRDLFVPTDHHTICPFKGQASYWSLQASPQPEDNLVWYYPQPFEEVAGIAGHVAFYDSRVRVEVDDPGPDQPGGPDISVKRFPWWGDVADLVALLDVEPVGDLVFRSGPTPAFGRDVVDGQQLLGQAVVAAAKAEPGKRVWSTQLFFSRAATTREPVELRLAPEHRGRTFSTFHVAVHQEERLCAPGLAVLDDDAPDLIHHFATRPDVPGPLQCVPYDMGVTGRDLRILDGAYSPDPERVGPPEIHAWIRFREVPDHQYLHQAVVAHSSGLFQIAAALRPHAGYGEARAHDTLSTANLGIGVTFHEDIDATGWLLFSNVGTHAGRGLTFGAGQVFTAAGALVASFQVHGMVRPFQGPVTPGPSAL